MENNIFDKFLPYMRMVAITVMWPGPFVLTLVPGPTGVPHKIWLQFAKKYLKIVSTFCIG